MRVLTYITLFLFVFAIFVFSGCLLLKSFLWMLKLLKQFKSLTKKKVNLSK